MFVNPGFHLLEFAKIQNHSRFVKFSLVAKFNSKRMTMKSVTLSNIGRRKSMSHFPGNLFSNNQLYYSFSNSLTSNSVSFSFDKHPQCALYTKSSPLNEFVSIVTLPSALGKPHKIQSPFG